MDEVYLGVPLLLWGNKSRAFRGIKEKVCAKINSWSGRYLSQMGRTVLIKSVAQAIPAYITHCFYLPKSLLHKIDNMLVRYWWRGSRDKKGIHWKNWNNLCTSRFDGGIGFKDMECFNLALLSKQW